MEIKTWKEVFISNYEGKSAEAKALQPYLKSNYKGNVYIPWAVMERLTYMCDENAQFRVIYNERGGLVHTDKEFNRNYSKTNDKEVQTEAVMFSHFVRVELEFMGKVFIDDYAIQDKDYTSLKIYDQNSVNKAVKRAMAKVASRATGLGLKLYEGEDLQFDTPEEPKKPVLTESPAKSGSTSKKTATSTVKTEPKVEAKVETKVEPKVEAKVVVENNSGLTINKSPVDLEVKEAKIVTETPVDPNNYEPAVVELVDFIKHSNKEAMTKALMGLNKSIVKKYGFALNVEDDEPTLLTNCSKLKDASKVKLTIIKLLGE